MNELRQPSIERYCAHCDARVVLGPLGYTHADGPDQHVPTPVRRVRGPVFDVTSRGHKRPSGPDALFTQGDGRRR
jgi:hypothetical protein